MRLRHPVVRAVTACVLAAAGGAAIAAAFLPGAVAWAAFRRADVPLPEPQRAGIVLAGAADVALACAALVGRRWPRRARLATAVGGLVVVLALMPVEFEDAGTWQDVRSGHAGLVAAGSFVVAALALLALGDGAGRRQPRLAALAAIAFAALGFAAASAARRDAPFVHGPRPRATPPATACPAPPERAIMIVPLDPQSATQVARALPLLGARVDPSQIQVAPIWGLPASAIDPVRHMVVAEDVSLRLAGCGGRAFQIAVTRYDLETIGGESWVFGSIVPQLPAVVSFARFDVAVGGGQADAALRDRRLAKELARAILVGRDELPPAGGPDDLLAPAESLADLDRAGGAAVPIG